MSTAAVFGSVASVELQYSFRTGQELDIYTNCIRGQFYEESRAGNVFGVEVIYTPKECAEAKWAVWMREVERKPDLYPDVVLEAMKLCRTTPEENDWCTKTLHPIFNDYRALESKRRQHPIQLNYEERSYNENKLSLE